MDYAKVVTFGGSKESISQLLSPSGSSEKNGSVNYKKKPPSQRDEKNLKKAINASLGR
jgi:hypothetical protein